MIKRIEHQGEFFHGCGLPGEERELNVHPAHPNGFQLSRDRWLFVYTTRSYRGNDDERSGVYQLRQGGIAGPVIKEGWLCRTCDDWDPLGDGRRYVKQLGHPVVMGVPKGALINGGRVAHENHFAACWRVEARYIDPKLNFMLDVEEFPGLMQKTRHVEWVQFRLNDAEDDIEFFETARPLRQAGYEKGLEICSQEGVRWMVQTFVPPVPYNGDCSEWVMANNTNDPRVPPQIGEQKATAGGTMKRCCVMPIRFKFNSKIMRYEWVESGALQGEDLMEASIVPWKGDWVISARRSTGKTMAWARTGDLFGREALKFVMPENQPNWFPSSAFLCPDGEIRRAGGCIDISPYKGGRGPIYLVEIDVEREFAVRKVQEIYDGVRAGLPMQGGPLIDFPKLVAHGGGKTQYCFHRVRSQMLNDPRVPTRRLKQEEIDKSGIYWAKVEYGEDYPGYWQFA